MYQLGTIHTTHLTRPSKMTNYNRPSLPPGPLSVAYEALHKIYVETSRHQEALEAVKRTLLGGATSGAHNGLALIGPTGSGKTATLKHSARWLKHHMGLSDKDDSPFPIVLMTSRSTGRTIANNILRAGRDPLAGTRTQDDAETHIRETSRNMEVVGFALDEFHHAFAAKSESEAARMSLTLKTLVNSLSKPIVVVGVDGLEDFLDSNQELRQRFERRVYLEDPKVASKEDLRDVRTLLKAMASVVPCEHDCDLNSQDMLIRLLYAASCRFGSVVNFVRSACEIGAMARCERVNIKHFTEAYRLVAPRDRRKTESNAFHMPIETVRQLVNTLQGESGSAGGVP